MARSNVDRFTDRLLLRRLSRSFGRSSSGIGRSSGGISRGSSSGIRRGSGGVRGGSGGIRRSSGGIRRGSGGFRGSGFRSGFLLAAGRHHRKGRNRGGESNVQFHVGVPQSVLVERETEQTFVCSDCIAARNFIDLRNHLKQVQILSATGDNSRLDRRWRRPGVFVHFRSNLHPQGLESHNVALRQSLAAVSPRIESRHELTRH
jgi:hypothetical protein